MTCASLVRLVTEKLGYPSLGRGTHKVNREAIKFNLFSDDPSLVVVSTAVVIPIRDLCSTVGRDSHSGWTLM